MKQNNSSKDYYMLAFTLGTLITGYVMFFLGQSWNRDDMALLRSHIHNIRVEQDKPRLAVPAEQPRERSSATAQKKVINKYYRMEKPAGKVPGLPASASAGDNENSSGGKK